MSRHKVLFGFMRGRRGDVIEVSPDHVKRLREAGFIGPALPAHLPQENKVVTPEKKEGDDIDAPQPRSTGRKRGTPQDG